MTRLLLMGALLALGAGCDRAEEGTRPVPLEAGGRTGALPEGAPKNPTASGAAPQAESAPAVEAPPGSALSADALRVGLEREALVQALGSCGERVKFIEPRSYRRALEIFQPKDGDCVARFGERHFVVVGDRVAQVEEGLRPRPAPQPEPRTWGDSSIPR